MKKSAFTLMEMLISVVILSVILLFLYNTMGNLKLSNDFFEKKVDELTYQENLFKTIYLDLSMAKKESIQIHNQEKELDTLIFQTSHSLHQKLMPYVAYSVKEDGLLYRIESFKPLSYPLEKVENEVNIDVISEVKNFRIYRNEDLILVDYRKNMKDINIFKVKVYN